jgi:hypothetical protein
VLICGNVLVESYDTSTVVLGGQHSLVEANLALGTIQDMTGRSDSSWLRHSFLKVQHDSWECLEAVAVSESWFG